MSREREFAIPSLHGIRGVAALIVFVSHAGLPFAAGGLGVTIFFFLSGYLITTLLRREFEESHDISLRKFYLRRVYRILPPMYLVLTVLLVLALAGVLQNQMRLGAMIAQYLQFTNYYLMLFDMEEGPSLIPFTTPTWSLAVEEHFYLLYPLLLLVLIRRQAYRRIAVILAAICAAVLLWRCALVVANILPEYYPHYATDTRLDSLLFGCIMGLWMNPALDGLEARVSRNLWICLFLAGGLLLGISTVIRSPLFRETLRYTMQGVALFPLFFCAVRFSHWPILSWLEWPVMRGLGTISYTFYLTHLACIRLTEQYLAGTRLTNGIVALVAAILVSTASYYLIERHMATLRRRLHT